MSIECFLEKLGSKYNFDFDKTRALTRHIKYLLVINNNVDASEKPKINDILSALHHLNIFAKVRTKNYQYLASINEKIHKNDIGNYPHTAFLSTIPPDGYRYFTEYLMMQSKMLEAALCLNSLTGYQKMIAVALQQYRSMVDNKENIIVILPNFNQSTFSLLTALDRLIKSLSTTTTTSTTQVKTINRVRPIRKLFFEYSKKAPIYKPRNRKKGITVTSDPEPTATPIISKVVETDDHNLKFIYHRQEFLNDSIDINDEERSVDQQRTEAFVELNSSYINEVQHSLTLQNQRAKVIINNIRRREKMLSTDTAQLTKYEINTLVRACLQHIMTEQSYTFLLLSLVTGQSLDAIFLNDFGLKSTKNQQGDEYFFITFKPSLPKNSVQNEVEAWINRASGSVILSMPKELNPGLLRISLDNMWPVRHEFIHSIDHIIQQLNKKHHINLTTFRIKNHLKYYLNHTGVDSSEITLITNDDFLQEPGVYYYQPSQQQLSTIFDQYTKSLFNNKNHQPPIKQTPNLTVGSQLQVKPHVVQLLFNELSGEIEKLPLNSIKNIIYYHQQYTLYTLLLLFLSSGHRPVCEAFETVNIFNLKNKTIYISDKELRTELASRVLVLPDIAVNQLEFYLDHLKQLAIFYKDISAEMSALIEQSLSGGRYLFFLIQGRKIDSMTPKIMSIQLQNIFPIKLNWHRHFMRTQLRNRGICAEFVNAWMGHLSQGESNFSRFGGISMKNMRLLANNIETLLTADLAIKPLKNKTLNNG